MCLLHKIKLETNYTAPFTQVWRVPVSGRITRGGYLLLFEGGKIDDIVADKHYQVHGVSVWLHKRTVMAMYRQ